MEASSIRDSLSSSARWFCTNWELRVARKLAAVAANVKLRQAVRRRRVLFPCLGICLVSCQYASTFSFETTLFSSV
jgi:hypothetical protein